MKKIVGFMALLALLSSCGSNTPQVAEETNKLIPEAIVDQAVENSVDETSEYNPDLDSDIGIPIQDIYTLKTSYGNELNLEKFGERMSISSPLELSGTVPSTWVHEESFFNSIYTIEGELIKEAYGEATVSDEDGQLIEENVPFTASIEFDNLEDNYQGKIRFASSLLQETEGTEDLVEAMILFE